ncbi:hemerythrin domain-containing protein [Clostridium gasigenes]|uniref:Hemerythrin domain-containing protein n=1 Tax=Clostridium gasigenes TaxID=94869 RepID=A0A7X0R5P8_9CLOT|nr:hemerythrin domain-containing protein [Clostridium gasigenes]MBB6622162.1 hemerythrin domain-containing protein [Clostridium gasigenes]MBB6713728.1 hemerythrin domain-containing protein [Clostridium gasigenes]MBU3087001.1 hemerythrin domain-containing protein [Clostridium gasigenes]MBU3106295.1 hemerythrin domain-containing protein [Clostridium gasigenes]MBU3134703.1 hemerythrin domain-containing protein [Clostridium gasigenes]
MANIENLERQHVEIKDLFLKIKQGINSNDIKVNLDVLVKNINTLAGKLNIHMNSEDKFLYPALIESKDQQLKEIAKQYSEEMGHIHVQFNNYKNKFNTRSKILSDTDGFLKESKEIIKLLENRISKEDMYLYPKMKSV